MVHATENFNINTLSKIILCGLSSKQKFCNSFEREKMFENIFYKIANFRLMKCQKYFLVQSLDRKTIELNFVAQSGLANYNFHFMFFLMACLVFAII